jgi:DNA-binding beta-propeller fold protein YncE
MLTKDQCGVTAQTSSATVAVNNAGGGRVTATGQLLQFTGVANQPSPATAPTLRNSQSPAGSQLVLSFNPAAARGLGTVTPPHDFLIQSPEAINIPNRVRVYENNRDSDARGTILPIPIGGVAGEAFPDLLLDAVRRRIYIANAGLNRVEVFDIQQQAFLSPIKVGQLPRSMALTPDASASSIRTGCRRWAA